VKIIFTDHYGCGAALVAAYYRIGILSSKPTLQALLQLPLFLEFNIMEPGFWREIGVDETGNQVYTLGIGNEGVILLTSAADLLRQFKAIKDIRIIDVSSFNGKGLKYWYLLGKYLGGQGLARRAWAADILATLPKLLDYLAETRPLGFEYSNLDLAGVYLDN